MDIWLEGHWGRMDIGSDRHWVGWTLGWVDIGLDGHWARWTLGWMDIGLDGHWVRWTLGWMYIGSDGLGQLGSFWVSQSDHSVSQIGQSASQPKCSSPEEVPESQLKF